MFKTAILPVLLLVLTTGLILVGVLRYGFPYSIWENPKTSLKKFESDFSFFFSENNEDKELRLKISEAYCEVLRVSGKVTIDGFSECAEKYSDRPLDLYRAMTQKTIGSSWDDLTRKEKEIVVGEVLSAKASLISSINTNQQLQALQEQLKQQMGSEQYKNYESFFK